MNPYSSLCDDFGVYVYVNTKMELPRRREAVLHFFDSLQKTFPQMTDFDCRENGEYVLEEDREQGGLDLLALVGIDVPEPHALDRRLAEHLVDDIRRLELDLFVRVGAVEHDLRGAELVAASQVAHAETPRPLSFSSDARPSQRALAPVAMITDRARYSSSPT